MIFVKKWTFLLSLIFFEKDLDVIFYYVRNEKKKGCVDYKNVILRYCENVFFRGLTQDFRQIFETSSESHFL